MNDTVPLLCLEGAALERGRQQAQRCPDRVPQVRQAVQDRLRALVEPLARADVQAWLQGQENFLRANDPEGFAELLGIAQGYGIDHGELLAYLHGNVLADVHRAASMVEPNPEADGCTVWAQPLDRDGAVFGARVAKNRDYSGEHGRLQCVFLHRDPAWGGRTLLCLGSLGSPGAFSSGMNSDGLAVVDTQISTRDHGSGWLRYFLMTALLRQCRDVPEAVAMIRTVPHAGGGSLVLGDREGRIAWVELGHREAPVVVTDDCWVAHTNHYLDATLARDFLPAGDDLSDSSAGRLAVIEAALDAQPAALSLEQAQALMARHAAQGQVCRHAVDGHTGTLSCALYDTAQLQLVVSNGPPCEGRWATYSVVASHG